MIDTGVVRRIDPLGRLVIPKEVRDKLGLGVNEPVQIYVDGDSVCIKKYKEVCLICGDAEEVFSIKGKNICMKCAEIIKRDI